MLVFRKRSDFCAAAIWPFSRAASFWTGSTSHVAATTRCRPVTQPATATTRHRVSPRRGVGSRRDCRYAQLHAAHDHTRCVVENADYFASSRWGIQGGVACKSSVRGWPNAPCALCVRGPVLTLDCHSAHSTMFARPTITDTHARERLHTPPHTRLSAALHSPRTLGSIASSAPRPGDSQPVGGLLPPPTLADAHTAAATRFTARSATHSHYPHLDARRAARAASSRASAGGLDRLRWLVCRAGRRRGTRQ